MSKKVSIGSRPTAKNQAASVDKWVNKEIHPKDKKTEKVSAKSMKRLTIDVPESLHRAIKMQCAMRGTKIADEVRELLMEKYGDY